MTFDFWGKELFWNQWTWLFSYFDICEPQLFWNQEPLQPTNLRSPHLLLFKIFFSLFLPALLLIAIEKSQSL